jgi:hypothetical protein
VPEDWQGQPAKLRQKDRDARWTVKTTKAKPRAGATPVVDLAIPAFGYQNHISADRRHRMIRRWPVTDAAAHAGARLADLLVTGNTAAGVWADTAYRSQKTEDLLSQRMLVSHIHRKKPAGRPMPERTARPTRGNRPCGRTSSTSLPSRRPGWACSPRPSVSPGPPPRSGLPIWSPTCAACSGCNARSLAECTVCRFRPDPDRSSV